jgi:hypothetical protein
MGYTQYEEGVSLRSIIREHARSRSHDVEDGSKRVVQCLAKCLVGNRRFRCRLWVVFQPRHEYPVGHDDYPAGHVRHYAPFIAVWDLDCQAKRWGYRDHTEACHPFLYDCPLSYLAMCPEENLAWRQNVQAHHYEHPRRSPGYRYQSEDKQQAIQTRKQTAAAKQDARFAKLRRNFLQCESPAGDGG